MKSFLALFDVVPGWLYAIALAVLSLYALNQHMGEMGAQRETALEHASLSDLKAGASAAAASSVQTARSKEQGMADNQTKVSDELQTILDSRNQRIADLERRMRDQARAYAAAGGQCHTEGSRASEGGDGVGDPRLRSVDEQDPVFLDGQAQHEIAELTVRANETGATLKACRSLLRKAWQASQ